MYRKTRNKIIFSIMIVLLLFLVTTLATIYGTTYFSLKKENQEMLDRYVEMFSLENPPGKTRPPQPEPTSEGNLYDLSSFYSVAYSRDGEVVEIDTGRNGRHRQAEILSFAEQIRAEKKSSGKYHRFIYRVENREEYVLVAFMDTSLTLFSMGTVLSNTMLAGGLATVILFFVSFYLARSIVQPLEESDRKQRQFVSDAEHELKTPISVISANGELLSRQIGENECLANIQYENERMAGLVNDLLTLSRVENTSWQPETVDLSRLTQREVLPFESLAYEHDQEIKTHIEDNIRVKGNRQQLGQLISILVDNAIGHGTVGIPIEVNLRKDHRDAVLSVKNGGEEIPEECRNHIFDRFFRMDEARESVEGHYGLGLSIAKAIVDAHKGTIHMEYQDGYIILLVHLNMEN